MGAERRLPSLTEMVGAQADWLEYWKETTMRVFFWTHKFMLG